ncbi:MAG: RNase P subunit p30 family protein [Candidatus Pacearchaeota archaeon]|jgi:RNase P/RNase MRP subunit p30
MDYITVSGNDFNEIRKKIRESKGKKVIFSSSDDDIARKVLEKEKINVLLISLMGRRDKLKQRNSGFNQVLAKLAKRKDVAIGINLDELVNSSKEEKAEILGRIRQNIVLCNKNKLKMIFISKESKDSYNLKALGLVLSMPTWMAGVLTI